MVQFHDPSNYTGTTTISDATLNSSGTGSLAGSSGITLYPGGQLRSTTRPSPARSPPGPAPISLNSATLS